MRVPGVPTPELGVEAAPATAAGARRAAFSLAMLGSVAVVLGTVMLVAEQNVLWGGLYVAQLACAVLTWLAVRWARPVLVALALLGCGPLAVGFAVGALDPVPTILFGGGILVVLAAVVLLLTPPARAWFAVACARRTLGD